MTLPPDFKRFSAEDFRTIDSEESARLVAIQANEILEARFAEWAGRQVEVFEFAVDDTSEVGRKAGAWLKENES